MDNWEVSCVAEDSAKDVVMHFGAFTLESVVGLFFVLPPVASRTSLQVSTILLKTVRDSERDLIV